MSIHLVLAFLGCMVAAAGTVVLAIRLRRAAGIAVADWALAALGLTVSLGAQALGAHRAFGPGTFRATELGAQVVAPLALCAGLAEVVGRTLAARFAARLLLPALGLIAVVILGTDPLTGAAFSATPPAPSVYYQIIPNYLLKYGLGPVTAVVALTAIGLTLLRIRRNPGWRRAAAPVWAAGIAALALALPAMSALLTSATGRALPFGSLFVLLCLLAAGLTWFAGVRLARVDLRPLHDGAPATADGEFGADEAGGWTGQNHWAARYDEPGDSPAGELTEDRGVYRGNGLYRPAPGYQQGRDGYSEAGDGYGEAGDGYGQDAHGYGDAGRRYGAGRNGYADGTDGADSPNDYDTAGADTAVAGAPVAGDGDYRRGYDSAPGPGRGSLRVADDPAGWRPGTGSGHGFSGGATAADIPVRERLFGQIAIYTLHEGQVDRFDQLTEHVAAQVRSGEPDTLVYIVHAVPSAPMQRILYEVYRDRDAHERHKQQPYVSRFDADSAALVLATNVIELGLQQATVSPFPSIADLFGEPGYDTSGFARPDYGADYGTRPASPGDAPRSVR